MLQRASSLFIALMAAAGIASAQLVDVVPGPGAERMDERREKSNTPDTATQTQGKGATATQATRNDTTGKQSGNSEKNQGTRSNQSGGMARSHPKAEGMEMECRPSSVNCPVTSSSGGDVTTSDDLPTGSAQGKLGGPMEESRYPTSPGTGSFGSGRTGAPTGPAPGPVLGTGR